MNKRWIALFLILILLLIPTVSGVFAEPDSDQDVETTVTEAPETAATEPGKEDPVETEEPEPVDPVIETEAPVETDPPETETETDEPDDPQIPDDSEEPVGPQEFSEFTVDLEPSETEPGRESSYGLTDASVVRYRYFWVVRFHASEEDPATEIKAYILNEDGSDVFETERTEEKTARLAQPADPKGDHAAFAGWFTDPDCTESTAFAFSANTVITSHLDLYAKWEAENGTIIIRRKLDQDEEQSFLYTVEGSDGNKITVVIPAGKSSVTIIGAQYGVSYRITEEISWSWRFNCKKQSQTVTLSDSVPSVTVTFEGEKAVTKWISAISLLKIVNEG